LNDSIRPGVPAGLRDMLPAEAAQARYLEEKIRGVFELWGYGEVVTPILEFETTLAPASAAREGQDLFGFLDRDGKLLALRPEMTTAIARVAAERLAGEPPPHRLYYVGDVFRQDESQEGQGRQFKQAGIELIGEGNAYADAEVILLLCECLAAAGLNEFSVGVGQIDFLRAQLRALPISDDGRSVLKEALARHNRVAFEAGLRAMVADDDTVVKAMASLSLRGGADVLEAAKELALSDDALAAVDHLETVFGLVRQEGGAGRVLVDLGIIRRFDYYTGVLFDAYAAPLGFPIGGGGRYDNLLGDFGRPGQAAGFAIGLERLHIALEESGAAPRPEVARYFVYDETEPARAMSAATLFRRDGHSATCYLRPISAKLAARLAGPGAKVVRASDILEQE